MNWSELKSRSYCPYSNQPSAAIVQGKTGAYYAGVRVENVSFPLTITAIQAALFSCLSESDYPVKLIIAVDDEPDLLNYWVSQFNMDYMKSDDIDEIELYDAKKSISADIGTALQTLLPKAIVKQSKFPVACLIELENGFIEGVNIEVDNWQLGLCAERVAIAKAYATGHTNFKSIYVHTAYGEFSSPCGACRQVIYEHLPFHDIHLHHSDGTRSKLLTVDLLPYHFKSNFLSGNT